jgi:hypothetical protein
MPIGEDIWTPKKGVYTHRRECRDTKKECRCPSTKVSGHQKRVFIPIDEGVGTPKKSVDAHRRRYLDTKKECLHPSTKVSGHQKRVFIPISEGVGTLKKASGVEKDSPPLSDGRAEHCLVSDGENALPVFLQEIRKARGVLQPGSLRGMRLQMR